MLVDLLDQVEQKCVWLALFLIHSAVHTVLSKALRKYWIPSRTASAAEKPLFKSSIRFQQLSRDQFWFFSRQKLFNYNCLSFHYLSRCSITKPFQAPFLSWTARNLTLFSTLLPHVTPIILSTGPTDVNYECSAWSRIPLQ